MEERSRTDVVDQLTWWCPRCRSRRTTRENSIFYNSRVPLQKWLLLIHMWAWQYPVTDAAEQVAVSKSTATKIFTVLRGICREKLRQSPISLGGSVSVVQIDDSCFCHKPKVMIVTACVSDAYKLWCCYAVSARSTCKRAVGARHSGHNTQPSPGVHGGGPIKEPLRPFPHYSVACTAKYHCSYR